MDQSHVRRVINKMKCEFQKDNNFDGRIDSIQDIEENIWVPKLGLKGKVDVSANVRASASRCESIKTISIAFR